MLFTWLAYRGQKKLRNEEKAAFEAWKVAEGEWKLKEARKRKEKEDKDKEEKEKMQAQIEQLTNDVKNLKKRVHFFGDETAPTLLEDNLYFAFI